MSSNAHKVVNKPNDIERFENIRKSQQDKRLYRGLKLSNGLRVLLISDPTTDKSAASLAVYVGAYVSEYLNSYYQENCRALQFSFFRLALEH